MADSKYFGIPFGATGDKATIPEATQPSGAVSYQQGFGPDYERDPATDPLAKRVPRDETNEFYYQLSNAVKYLQLYGAPEWFPVDGAGNPVSYPQGAVVRVTAAGVTTLWQSLVNVNTATPGTDATKWDFVPTAELLQNGFFNFALAGGSASAITITLPRKPSTYSPGLIVRVKAIYNCEGATTLNVNGLGARALLRQGGGSLNRFDFQAGDTFEAIYDGSVFQLLSPALTQFLSSQPGITTLYVRPGGNDNNDGSANTDAAAFATIDGAAAYALRRFNVGNQSTIIQLGVAGNYDGCSIRGFPNLTIRGNNASPQSYIVGGVRANAMRLDYCQGFLIEGLKLRNGITVNQSSNGLLLGASQGLIRDAELDPVIYHGGYAHINILDGGVLAWARTIKFMRSSPIGIDVGMGGTFSGGAFADPATIQMGSGLNQETFLRVAGGRATVLATAFTGSSGGKRFDVSLNGVINTAGAGANFLPGDQAGIANTGGIYA